MIIEPRFKKSRREGQVSTFLSENTELRGNPLPIEEHTEDQLNRYPPFKESANKNDR